MKMPIEKNFVNHIVPKYLHTVMVFVQSESNFVLTIFIEIMAMINNST